jgi:hypothetical protein
LSPSVARYLEALPNGIESYPEATVKGAILRAGFEDSGFTAEPGALPASLERCIQDPPAIGAWAPETLHSAFLAAVYDDRFLSHGGMKAYEAWVRERNRRLFRGPLYRVLFFVTRPERIFNGTQKRWSAFHRGSELEIVHEAPKGRTLRLTHPPHLFSEAAIVGFGAAFRAVGDAVGLRGPQTRFDRERPDATVFVIEWS